MGFRVQFVVAALFVLVLDENRSLSRYIRVQFVVAALFVLVLDENHSLYALYPERTTFLLEMSLSTKS